MKSHLSVIPKSKGKRLAAVLALGCLVPSCPQALAQTTAKESAIQCYQALVEKTEALREAVPADPQKWQGVNVQAIGTSIDNLRQSYTEKCKQPIPEAGDQWNQAIGRVDTAILLLESYKDQPPKKIAKRIDLELKKLETTSLSQLRQAIDAIPSPSGGRGGLLAWIGSIAALLLATLLVPWIPVDENRQKKRKSPIQIMISYKINQDGHQVAEETSFSTESTIEEDRIKQLISDELEKQKNIILGEFSKLIEDKFAIRGKNEPSVDVNQLLEHINALGAKVDSLTETIVNKSGGDIGTQENVKIQLESIDKRVQNLEEQRYLAEDSGHYSHDYEGMAAGTSSLKEKPTYTQFVNNLVKSYNAEREKIPHYYQSHKFQIVAETSASFSDRRKGSTSVFLESHNEGDYWVISEDDSTYWLVPKAEINILREYNLSLVELLFDCQGYREDEQRFKLIYPAKLKLTGDGKNFELDYQGELVFS